MLAFIQRDRRRSTWTACWIDLVKQQQMEARIFPAVSGNTCHDLPKKLGIVTLPPKQWKIRPAGGYTAKIVVQNFMTT